jgi:hypothetical protein
MKKVIWSLIVYTLFLIPLLGQKTADTLFCRDFFIPKNDYSPKRMNSLIGFWGITYGAFSYGLYQSWYKNQNLQPFHFFNDGKEWQQMDKAGHFFSGYFQMAYNYKLARWAGLDKKKSLIYSSAISTLFLTTLEFFDGFGEGWGFSGYDMASNLSGTGSFLIQETLWNEQRILVKESVFPVRYARQTITSNGITTSLEQRASKLYGQSLLQRALKDYNVQTYWLSVSPHSFGWSVWPKWLNLSFGYGAQGMFGGLENKWSTPSGIFDYTDQPRYRQFYLAPDINFSKINIRSPLLRTIFNAANIIKTPTPALEYNRIDGFVFHLIFF